MPKKTYFASDFHLGVDAKRTSRERELQIVRWLNQCAADAESIYLVGDLFEFWHEYKTVIPKGNTRFLGKLAELRDAGIPIHIFTGNHDLWMFGYFEEELGIPVHYKPITTQIAGKTFFIGHGDGLGPGDMGYKRMKKIFTNPICQWMFSWLHPDLGNKLAGVSSEHSRATNWHKRNHWLGEENEWLVRYANRKLDTIPSDYFIFGHRHLPVDWLLKNQKSRYINLGEWMHECSYGVFDGVTMEVRFFENEEGKVNRNW
jgi:UDP-2,3-diacylglucosamine hydrolase